jgi:hypothetical protein
MKSRLPPRPGFHQTQEFHENQPPGSRRIRPAPRHPKQPHPSATSPRNSPTPAPRHPRRRTQRHVTPKQPHPGATSPETPHPSATSARVSRLWLLEMRCPPGDPVGLRLLPRHVPASLRNIRVLRRKRRRFSTPFAPQDPDLPHPGGTFGSCGVGEMNEEVGSGRLTVASLASARSVLTCLASIRKQAGYTHPRRISSPRYHTKTRQEHPIGEDNGPTTAQTRRPHPTPTTPATSATTTRHRRSTHHRANTPTAAHLHHISSLRHHNKTPEKHRPPY